MIIIIINDYKITLRVAYWLVSLLATKAARVRGSPRA